MTNCFANSKCGVGLALIHILASAVMSLLILLQLKNYLDDDDSYPEKWLESRIATSVFLIFLCLLTILLCVILIVGICRQTHHLMAPWLGLTFACTVGSFIYSLVAICSSAINLLSFQDNVYKIISGLTVLAFHIGVFYPIFLLYKEILVIRLKKDGLYEGDSISFDDELVDADETYHL